MNIQHQNGLNSIELKQYSAHLSLFFIDNGIIVAKDTAAPYLPLQETMDQLKLHISASFVDGEIVISQCQSRLDPEDMLFDGYQIQSVKSYLSEVEFTEQQPILRAYHWLNWHNRSKFCGQCGGPLVSQVDATEKCCRTCNASFFPRFSPAVMVLIQRNNQLLLARSPHFRKGIYSVVAGFIDVGETAEQAAHREVKEELDVEITDLEYFSSQTWPFPDSFMIAFKAKYLRGEITIDEDEIEDAQWFDLNNLPPLPSQASISRQLIDSAR